MGLLSFLFESKGFSPISSYISLNYISDFKVENILPKLETKKILFPSAEVNRSNFNSVRVTTPRNVLKYAVAPLTLLTQIFSKEEN